MMTDPFCILCGNANEKLDQIFKYCSWAKKKKGCSWAAAHPRLNVRLINSYHPFHPKDLQDLCLASYFR